MPISRLSLEQVKQAKALVIQTHWATVSLIQRRLKLGYRAAIEAVESLEAEGVVTRRSSQLWLVADADQKPDFRDRLKVIEAIVDFVVACRKWATKPADKPVLKEGFSLISRNVNYDTLCRSVGAIFSNGPENSVDDCVSSVLQCLIDRGCCHSFSTTDIELLEILIHDTFYSKMAKSIQEEDAMKSHKVITKDYPENLNGGIMVCGINYGYSDQEELLEGQGVSQQPEPLSFFSDTTVNNSRYRTRLLNWLAGWQINLETQPGKEGSLERSFWQTNWSDTQTRSVNSHEKIDLGALVNDADGILGLIEKRRPSVIIFIGSDLIQALNDIRLRERVEAILGPRPGNATEIFSKSNSDGGRRFKMYVQSFGDTSIICLPHTATVGLTNEQVASFELPAEIKAKFSR